MSWIQATENSLKTEWADLVKIFTGGTGSLQMNIHQLAVDIAAGVQVQEDQVAAGLVVVSKGLPVAITLVQAALAEVQTLGWATVPQLSLEIGALQVGLTELQTISADIAAGKTAAQIVVDAVTALNKSDGNVANLILTALGNAAAILKSLPGKL